MHTSYLIPKFCQEEKIMFVQIISVIYTVNHNFWEQFYTYFSVSHRLHQFTCACENNRFERNFLETEMIENVSVFNSLIIESTGPTWPYRIPFINDMCLLSPSQHHTSYFHHGSSVMVINYQGYLQIWPLQRGMQIKKKINQEADLIWTLMPLRNYISNSQNLLTWCSKSLI